MIISARRSFVAGVALLGACALLALGAAGAGAATFSVTTTADSFTGFCGTICSLRDAVSAANVDSTKDTILVPAGTYRLERTGEDSNNVSGDLDVTRPLVVRGAGPGVTTVRASFPTFAPDRVFDAIGADLTLEGLTVSGGVVVADIAEGGGIRAVNGTLELDGVAVSENRVETNQAASAFGGGVYVRSGNLTMRNSALIGNIAGFGGYGGGFLMAVSGFASLTNVTIARNRAFQNGGGAHFNNSSVKGEFAFVTVVENEAAHPIGGAGNGGGFGSVNTATIRSSIVARNVASSGPDCESPGNAPASLGGNVGPAACGFTQPTDSNAADPLLGPLTSTGVPVFEPLPGSPALDRGIAPCPATDARGVPRPQGGACDSGAAERPVAGPPAGGGGKATISAVKVSKTKFRAGPKVIANPGRGKTPVGTTISFRLSAAAAVKATVLRVAGGRRVAGKCLKPTPARKGKPRCTRLVGVGGLGKRSLAAGAGKLEFSGRVGGRNLAPGRYRVQLAVPGTVTVARTPVLRIVAGR